MTTPKVLAFYAIFFSLFISCGRDNAKPNEKRIALVRSASGDYYAASCLKGATAASLEECKVDVSSGSSSSRGFYGGGYNDPFLYYLLNLGNFEPSGFCGQLGNIWQDPYGCYNFWGVYPWQQPQQPQQPQPQQPPPPTYGCDYNWIFQDFYFYGGNDRECGYDWGGHDWGGPGYDDFAAGGHLLKLTRRQIQGGQYAEFALARRQGNYHAITRNTCPPTALCVAPPTVIQWVSHTEVEQVKRWIRQIRQARRQSRPSGPDQIQCLAMPTEERVYSETQGIIRQQNYPCGRNINVPGAATDQLINWFNSKVGI